LSNQSPHPKADQVFSEYVGQQRNDKELSPLEFAQQLDTKERASFCRLVEEFFEVGGIMAIRASGKPSCN